MYLGVFRGFCAQKRSVLLVGVVSLVPRSLSSDSKTELYNLISITTDLATLGAEINKLFGYAILSIQ